MVQIFNEKAGVFEPNQCPQIQNQPKRQEQLCRRFVPESFNATPQDEIHQSARHDQPQEGKVTAGVEQQRKDD